MSEITKLKSKIQLVPFVKMKVACEAQRVMRPPHLNTLLGDFDPEYLGLPVVNFREGHYFIIDGQHRIESCKAFLGEGQWESQSLECRVYEGMTLEQEADMFDRLNTQLTVAAFDKFQVRCTARRPDELAVYRIVEKAGLTVTASKGLGADNAVTAVSTLMRVYRAYGGEVLARSLKIAYGAFGEPGLSTSMIGGMALVCDRYNGSLDDKAAIQQLGDMRGGVGALMTRAGTLRKQTNKSVPTCVAAATVDVLNARKGGKKLPSWWKQD